MNTFPKVTVITVTRNTESTIARTIDSVLSQTYPNIELIIVDGASTDGTMDIVRGYGDRLRWISEPDRNYADAVNKGLAMATGHWVQLLSGDDYYLSRDAMQEAISQCEEGAVNYCSIMRSWPDGTAKRLPFSYESRWPCRGRKWQFWVSTGMMHNAMFIPKALYDKVGYMNLRWRFSPDADIILRLFKQAKLHYVPVVLICMEQGGYTQQARELTARQFAQISIEQGMPAWLAWAIYAAKLALIWPALIVTSHLGRRSVRPARNTLHKATLQRSA